MPALFDSLHEVAQVLSEHIREEVGIVDVQAGTPRDVTSTTEPAARLTLLYVTPQQGHRNDPPEPRPDGTRRFPPLTLACFVLVTTSGADSDEPVAAHHALGRIMALYHDTPMLHLPLSQDPGAGARAFTTLGTGEMSVVQVPMSLEQIDKVWTALDAGMQPWALFEVGPVQLASQRPDTAAGPLVRPGGIALDVRAGARPVVGRVTPEVVRPGGRVRVDMVAAGGLEGVVVSGVEVPTSDTSLTVAGDGAALFLSLDDGGLEDLGPGTHPLTLRAGGLLSRRSALRVAPAGEVALDAPASPHHPGDALVLTGANLEGAEEVVLWPDGGMAAPSQILTAALTDVSPGSVTVAPGALAGSGSGLWRVAVRTGERFTSYVLVEVES